MKSAIQEKLAFEQARIELAIDKYLPAKQVRPTILHQAMRYSMQAGGKRIRPVLLILGSEIFKVTADTSKNTPANPLAAAVAIECLHTYTLIHDDLPAVDNSDLRRGRAACHKKFNEPIALLAGDALLTHAFQLISCEYSSSPTLSNQLIYELASAASSKQLIGGQMEDIQNEGKATQADDIDFVYANKTAALIRAALLMGLRFCQPTKEQMQCISRVGFHLGMAFQIIDDILDASSNSDTIGKPVGLDAAAEKSTYIALLGISEARIAAKTHTNSAIKALESLGGDTNLMIQLIRELEIRSN